MCGLNKATLTFVHVSASYDTTRYFIVSAGIDVETLSGLKSLYSFSELRKSVVKTAEILKTACFWHPCEGVLYDIEYGRGKNGWSRQMVLQAVQKLPA